MNSNNLKDYNATNVNESVRDQALSAASKLGEVLFGKGTFRDYHAIRMELLRLFVRMNPDTKKSFNQMMPKSRGGSRRLYEEVAALVEVATLSPQGRKAYVTLSASCYKCELYGDNPEAFERMRESIVRSYNSIKPKLSTIIAGSSSSTMTEDIRSRMITINSYIEIGKMTTRRQQKPQSLTKGKSTSAPIPIPNQSSVMCRVAKMSGIRF
ncbi:MAG: hypothetical protein WC262_09150 [Bacteroidales bacterium]|jgi:hypothetical protein